MNVAHSMEPVPPGDWQTIGLAFVGIMLLIGASEGLRRSLGWPEEFTRKFVHILVGVMMFFIPILLDTALPMVLIALLFIVVNLVALQKGLLKGMHGARHSYGTVFYPLSFLILVVLCWPENIVVIIAPMMVLALGDAAAAIVGESLKQPHEYVLIRDRKSFEGSFTMFLVSAIVIFLVLNFYPFQPLNALSGGDVLWFALVAGLLVTAAEALSSKGSDNLSVPLSTALVLYFFLNHSPDENLRFTIGVALGLAAALVSLKLRFLSESGAVATFLLASIIFGFGGWRWTVPILTFFVLSSLLSKSGKAIKKQFDLIFEKGDRRDWAQVVANGGIAGMLMIAFMFFGDNRLFLLYLASLAAATADSWGTEIGTFFRWQPRLITNFRTVEPGTSGGITLPGTVGGGIGAFVIALSGWLVFPEIAGDSPLSFIAIITGCGIAGSLLDSMLGATVQSQFRCHICGKITERTSHCDDSPTALISGFRRMNNDLVNILCNAFAPLLCWFLIQ